MLDINAFNKITKLINRTIIDNKTLPRGEKISCLFYLQDWIDYRAKELIAIDEADIEAAKAQLDFDEDESEGDETDA